MKWWYKRFSIFTIAFVPPVTLILSAYFNPFNFPIQLSHQKIFVHYFIFQRVHFFIYFVKMATSSKMYESLREKKVQLWTGAAISFSLQVKTLLKSFKCAYRWYLSKRKVRFLGHGHLSVIQMCVSVKLRRITRPRLAIQKRTGIRPIFGVE